MRRDYQAQLPRHDALVRTGTHPGDLAAVLAAVRRAAPGMPSRSSLAGRDGFAPDPNQGRPRRVALRDHRFRPRHGHLSSADSSRCPSVSSPTAPGNATSPLCSATPNPAPPRRCRRPGHRPVRVAALEPRQPTRSTVTSAALRYLAAPWPPCPPSRCRTAFPPRSVIPPAGRRPAGFAHVRLSDARDNGHAPPAASGNARRRPRATGSTRSPSSSNRDIKLLRLGAFAFVAVAAFVASARRAGGHRAGQRRQPP